MTTDVTRIPRGMLTVDEILADLGGPGGPLSRRTWQEWRAKGTGPKCIKLPNGELRIRRAEYDRWLNSREAA
jgi:predicted DNA-binding transcriptional regulator AlpA